MTQYLKNKLQELNTEGYASLIDSFDKTCQNHRSEIAFSCLGHEVSFDDIDRMSAALAAYLTNDLKLHKGDRIAIQLPNITQYPIAVWGALRAGLIVVNTNPQYTAREQTHQFNDSGAIALIVLEDLLPVTNTVIENTGIKTVIVSNAMDLVAPDDLKGRLPKSSECEYVAFNDALALGAEAPAPAIQLSMDDIAVLQYTGGTTGPSKGAMLSHGNLFSGMTMSRLSVLLNERGDRETPIAPLPLYHVFGFTANIIGVFLHGGLNVLIPDPRNVGSIIKAMKDYPFTSMASVNTLLQGIMAHPEFDEVDFSHVRGVIAGGTALVKEIADEWQARTGSVVFEGYGLSETTAVATCNRPDDRELGTVGPPVKHVDLKVIDSNGDTLNAGEAGEVCIRGPHVMQGYWNRPDATAEDMDEEGWFRTGDIGIIQDNGRLKIVDRIKDMILVSGFNVYPNEIEEVVYSHPNITECAAIGVPNEASGEAVKLFVVSNDPDLTVDDVIAFCRRELTSYKVPKQIEFADDLPKSPAGKILRRELRERV